MKILSVISGVLLASVAFAQAKTPAASYQFLEHRVIPATGYDIQHDQYTIQQGKVIITAQYFGSQTDDSESTDPEADHYKYLHWHDNTRPDLSQVPKIGSSIKPCVLLRDGLGRDKTPMWEAASAPCFTREGDTLTFHTSPTTYAYVQFEIISEKVKAGSR